jgi:hypothetical protein
MTAASFPDLSDAAWQQTRATLQAYAQVLGAIRAALAPRQKHWWHVPLSVSAAGLTTTPIAVGEHVVELILSPIDHCLYAVTNRGETREIPLHGQPLTEFCDIALGALAGLGAVAQIERGKFSSTEPRPYDRAAAARFWQALPQIDAAFKRLKAEHRGESGPVMLWPHGFDLALLLFTGRQIPGTDPADEEASDEQMNFGFAPGDGAIPEPYFYATAFPTPAGFVGASLPAGASWHTHGWNGAVLRYSALRAMDDPPERLLEFLRAARDAGLSRMK